ncbi:DUF92 domain-containing protein [Colwelliaceae bacterium 6471]
MNSYILFSLLVAAIVSWFVYWRGYLTWPATILACIFASIILIASGPAIGLSVGTCFFITGEISRSTPLLTQHANKNSQKIIKLESVKLKTDLPRDFLQVFANGLILIVLAMLSVNSDNHQLGQLAAILGCIGAVAGDTWASDAGFIAKQQPRMLLTGKLVSVGTPGAVTKSGIFLTGLSGLVASLVFILVSHTPLSFPHKFDLTFTTSMILIISAVCGGIFGALVDSILNTSFQGNYQAKNMNSESPKETSRSDSVKGDIWLSNNLINFINSIVGAATAWLMCSLMVMILRV